MSYITDLSDELRFDWELHELGDRPAPAAQVLTQARPITLRFGLTGRRWGDQGPVVLLLHARETAPESLAQLIEPLLAKGKQVIALDDPTDPAAEQSARANGFAYAIAEAAVEIRWHELVVADALAEAAAAKAVRLAA